MRKQHERSESSSSSGLTGHIVELEDHTFCYYSDGSVFRRVFSSDLDCKCGHWVEVEKPFAAYVNWHGWNAE